MSGAVPAPSGPDAWVAYLDEVERHAVRLLEADDDTEVTFPLIPQPDGDQPTGLDARVREVSALVQRATAVVLERRSGVAAEIAALRPRPARSPYATRTDGVLDTLG